MAIKKSDLYSSIWGSCDQLRGGMDAGQYKDYVLFMLFIKYVSDKYADFEQVVYNPKLPITNVMAETIQASDVGPDLAYYLGSNPQEAARISRLSPFLQAKEIGKIEAKLLDNPPVKKTSSAPAPISPVTAKAAGNPSYDTTDPRSVKSMSTSEWIEAERQRQIRKWEAQQKLR